MFTLPALYLPLAAWRFPHHSARTLAGAGAAFVASLLVHPTNVFAPRVAVPAIALYFGGLRTRFLSLRFGLKAIVSLGAILAASAVVLVGWPWWRAALRRAISTGPVRRVLQLLVELFSGVTVDRYIAGTLAVDRTAGVTIVQAISVLVLLAIVVGMDPEDDGPERPDRSAAPRECRDHDCRLLSCSWRGLRRCVRIASATPSA